MFITDQDYKVVIGDNALRVVSQTSEENRANAEAEAQEEIASYLRPIYDTNAIFAAEGDSRNRLIVMYTCDIALYHMVSAMPQKLGSEIRKERYERAVKWLEGGTGWKDRTRPASRSRHARRARLRRHHPHLTATAKA